MQEFLKVKIGDKEMRYRKRCEEKKAVLWVEKCKRAEAAMMKHKDDEKKRAEERAAAERIT